MRDRPLSIQELRALRLIRNQIVHSGQAPSIRDLQAALGYGSPRSAAKIIERLESLGLVRRQKTGERKLQILRDLPNKAANARTVTIPLVGTAPCGAPLLAEQNVEAMIPVSVALARPPARYFLLRAQGDSMNLAGISDGDLVLVKQQATAENGDRVVALIDDEATIKEFRRTADAVALLPQSKNKTHRPIYLTTEFQIQGIVKATLPGWRKG